MLFKAPKERVVGREGGQGGVGVKGRLGCARILAGLFLCLPMIAADAANTELCAFDALTLEEMLAVESACLDSADFMYALGQVLNRVGRYSEALDRLEFAIMQSPEFWRAQIEYAIALQGSGGESSAAALLRQLAREEKLPRQLRAELEKIENKVRVEGSKIFAHRTLLGFSIGYDDNLMGVTRYDNLQLTLPSGSLPVTLDAVSHPKGGAFSRVELMHERQLLNDAQGSWRLNLLGSYRWAPGYEEANLGHVGVALMRQPHANGGVYGSLLLQNVFRGGGLSLWQVQAGVGGEHGYGTWRFRLGVESYLTRYPATPVFGANYGGLLLQLSQPEAGMFLQLRRGSDRPIDTARPGGAQYQSAVRLGKYHAFAGGWLSGEYEYAFLRDQDGYSSILENNAKREIRRQVMRAEYRWFFSGLTPYVGVEWLDQRSNLALFSPRNLIVSIGVRHLW